MSTQAQTAGPVTPVMMLGIAGLVIGLGMTLASLMSNGHASFNTGSSGVTWGLPVVSYVFFSMASTGLAMVAAMAAMFGAKQFAPLIKRCTWLSIITLAAGFTSLALEMGHPFRLLWAVPLNFQPGSALVWMGLLYGICGLLLVIKFAKMHSGDFSGEGLTKVGFVGEVLALGTLGSAFGFMMMRPVWYGTEVPLMFLSFGVTIGVAVAVLINQLNYGMDSKNMPEGVSKVMNGSLATMFTVALGISIVFLFYRTWGGMWTNAEGFEAVHAIVGSVWFIIGAIALLGSFVIMMNPGMRSSGSMQVLAAVGTLVGMFIAVYNYVVGGQLVPLFKGAWVDGMISYTPSSTEWMIVVGAVGMVLAGWGLGEKMLNLADQPK